jgi:hypothetical protein
MRASTRSAFEALDEAAIEGVALERSMKARSTAATASMVGYAN